MKSPPGGPNGAAQDLHRGALGIRRWIRRRMRYGDGLVSIARHRSSADDSSGVSEPLIGRPFGRNATRKGRLRVRTTKRKVGSQADLVAARSPKKEGALTSRSAAARTAKIGPEIMGGGGACPGATP
jgi:hypothetical protein